MVPDLLSILTALIGTGGFTVGIYSFIDPTSAARIYGVPVQASHPSLTSILASDSGRKPPTSPSIPQPSSQDLSFVHALGIRNFTAGLTIILLTSYLHFLVPPSAASLDVRTAVQRALGIVILVGSLVPLVDAWVCWQHSRRVHDTCKAERQARQKGDKREALDDENGKSAIWEGREWQHEAYETGRKAGNLHAARSLVWVFGGLWCLLC